jgi:hypothetical protein
MRESGLERGEEGQGARWFKGELILIRVVLLKNYLLLRFKEKKRTERIAYLLTRKQNRMK